MEHADLYPRERLAAAQQAMSGNGIDAILVSPGADLRYLTGYHAIAMERLTCLVLTKVWQPTLVVPRLERPAAKSSPAAGMGLRIVDFLDGVDPYSLVVDALGEFGAGVIGLSNQMWAEKVLAFRRVLPDATQRLAGEVLAALRIAKTPAELAALRRAAQAIDAVHARMGEWLRPGRTEAEVAADIAVAIREVGHATVDFTIVGSGPNGASPHHEVSDRRIDPGDIVVVDIGGTMPDGYCSDCTRTYVLGAEVPADFAEGYESLRRAHAAGVEAVRPGVAAEQDRKSTRLNSSHSSISYAVFCLNKNNTVEPLRVPAHLIHGPPRTPLRRTRRHVPQRLSALSLGHRVSVPAVGRLGRVLVSLFTG